MEQSNFSLNAQRLSSHKFSLLQHIWSLEVGKVKLNFSLFFLEDPFQEPFSGDLFTSMNL